MDLEYRVIAMRLQFASMLKKGIKSISLQQVHDAVRDLITPISDLQKDRKDLLDENRRLRCNTRQSNK